MTQQWTARFSVTVSRCHGPSLAAGGHRQTASGRPHAESPTRDGAGRRNGRPAQIESRGTVPRALNPAAGSNEPRTRPHEQIAGRAEAPPLARAARAAGVTAAACDGDLSGARRSGSALALLPSPLLCVYVCVCMRARVSHPPWSRRLRPARTKRPLVVLRAKARQPDARVAPRPRRWPGIVRRSIPALGALDLAPARRRIHQGWQGRAGVVNSVYDFQEAVEIEKFSSRRRRGRGSPRGCISELAGEQVQ